MATSSTPKSYSENSVQAILSRLAVVADCILLHRPEGLAYVDAVHLAHELVSEGLDDLEREDSLAYLELQEQFFVRWGNLEKDRQAGQ